MKFKIIFAIIALTYFISKSHAHQSGTWFNIDFDTNNPQYAAGFGTAPLSDNGSLSGSETSNLSMNTNYSFDVWSFHQDIPNVPPQAGPDGDTDFNIQFVPFIRYNGADITAQLEDYVETESGDTVFNTESQADGELIDLRVSYNSTGGGRITVDKEIRDPEAIHRALQDLNLISDNPVGSKAGDAWDTDRINDSAAMGSTIGTLDGLTYGIEMVLTFTDNFVRTGGIDDPSTALNTGSGELAGTGDGSVSLTSSYSGTDAWEHSYITLNGAADPTDTYHTGGFTGGTPAGTWGSDNSNAVLWGYSDAAGPNPNALASPDYLAEYAASGSNGTDDNAVVSLTSNDPGGNTYVNASATVFNSIKWVSAQQWIEDPRLSDTSGNAYETFSSNAINSFDDLEVFLTPEPTSIIYLVLGINALFILRRRRKA